MCNEKEFGLTHKQALHNLGLVLFIITLLLCTELAWFVSELQFEPTLPKVFLIGLISGIILGFLYNKFFFSIWDPVTLKHKSEGRFSGCSSGCLLPIVTVGGVVAGRIASTIFETSFMGLISGCAIGFLYTVIGYLIFQVWRHKPKT
jgi:hypothetical protein